MKITKLTSTFKCPENFDEMQPNEKGKFCEKCAKTVIDFKNTHTFEFKEGEHVCLSYRKSQLNTPLIIKQMASGMLLATSLLATQACSKSSQNTPKTEIQENENTHIIKGIVLSEDTNQPIPNVEIQFVRTDTIVRSISNQKGEYTLTIPNELIEEKNVLRFVPDNKDSEVDYLTSDLLYSKKSDSKKLKTYLTRDYAFVGEMIESPEKINPPIVYLNGKKISYDEYSKLLEQKNIKIKCHSFFRDEFAQHLTKNDSIDSVIILESEQKN